MEDSVREPDTAVEGSGGTVGRLSLISLLQSGLDFEEFFVSSSSSSFSKSESLEFLNLLFFIFFIFCSVSVTVSVMGRVSVGYVSCVDRVSVGYR